MRINDIYWKWKRIFRKHKETISRVVSYTLIAVLIGAVAYAAYSIYAADVKREILANQEKDPTTIKATTKYNYGEDKFTVVAENACYMLEANFTDGRIRVTEKASQKQWYSNPDYEDEVLNDSFCAMKTRPASQIHVKFVNLSNCTEMEFDNYGGSIKKGNMKHELIENGVKFTFGFPTANVYIPVQYVLTEDGFQAEIVAGEIKGVGSNPYMVEEIALLPYFGAAGLEDEGYLLVPDGSGALIDYNNGKQAMQKYSAYVYGENITIDKPLQDAVKQTASLPVFGAKTNDSAFLGVVISGDATSNIYGSTSRKDSSYNHVYASAILGECSLQYARGNASTKKSSYNSDAADHLTNGNNYAVRYFFANGEKADYSGMSEIYREFLEERNQLKDSALADKKYMVLDLVGAVSIKKYVVGIKMPVVTAMTTYNEVCDIVKELKAQGVENLIVNYSGALNSGLHNKMYDRVAPESVLGSKKEFKQMLQYLEQEGVLLFIESNPVDIYENGNGYKENGDSAKTFFDKYAFQYKYNLDLNTAIESSRWHLLRPQLAAKVANDFADSAAKWNINQLSLARMGEVLYSNYSKDKNHITRYETIQLWQDTLKKLDEKSDYLLLHGGNAYCTPYADALIDVSDTFSDYDMQDQSIPFYQMTFQDRILLTSTGINTTVDYEHAFLKALETGSNLKFNLIYGDVSELVGTDYDTMVSYSYDYWKEIMVKEYAEMQKAVGQLAGQKILHHQQLTKDVSVTEYDSATVIVNYGTEPYTYGNEQVAARGYLVLSGGAK